MFKAPSAALLFAFTLIMAAPDANARDSVVDYYRELQAIERFELDYPLRKKGKGWVTRNLSWDSDVAAIVDTKSGYIFFSDEGTGGGNYETQIVLWRKTGGAPLIGIAEVGYDGAYPGGSRLRFFDKFDGNWTQITDYVMPEIGISDFLDDDMTIADLNALKGIRSDVYYVLPRKGTTIRAYLVTRDTYANAVCNDEDWFNPGDPAPYLRYCKTMQGRIETLIRVEWNKPDGRFTRGDRLRAGKVPWNAE